MSSGRQNCLIILSGRKDANSSLSFIQSFTLLHTAFTIQIATPGGKSLEFINQDEQRRRWLNDFRMKPFSVPISLQTIDPNRYSCLVIPHIPGAALDLADDNDLGQILKHFVKEKKPICAVGMGVVGLFSAIDDDQSWCFRRYVLTSTSVFEMAKSPDFESSPIIPEDIIKDRGGHYSCSEPDEVHIIVDRHLITGQNEQSTLIAMQNLVLLCNQKQGKSKQDRH